MPRSVSTNRHVCSKKYDLKPIEGGPNQAELVACVGGNRPSLV